jgi:putative ABC transport system substrate-binding protein
MIAAPFSAMMMVGALVLVELSRHDSVQLSVLSAGTEGEIDAAFASLARLQAGALQVSPDNFFGSRRELLLAQAARHAVPAIYA